MRGVDGNETCPSCYQVMIELNRFNAEDDAVPVDRGGWSGGGRAFWEMNYEAEGIARITYMIQAWFQQRRLNRVLRQFPNSLYCSNCGYIVKRK